MRVLFVLIIVLGVTTFGEVVKSDEVSNLSCPEDYTFVVFGDSRPVYANTPIPEAFLERVFREISWIGPSLIVHLGDLIYGYHESPNVIEKEYRSFLDVYEREAGWIPMIVVPANHELQSSEYSFERFREIFGNLMYYDFHCGSDHFVVVNTNFPDSIRRSLKKYGFHNLEDGYHELGMRDWLALVLKERARRTFVFSHVPMFSVELEGRYKNADDDFMRMVEGIEAYFAAHRHFTYVSSMGGTKLFILGGGGSTIDRMVFSKGPEGIYSYLVVESGRRIDYKLLVPFSIDVIRESGVIYVINRNPFPLTFRGIEVRGEKVKGFAVGEKVLYPIFVKVRKVGRKTYASVTVPSKSAVVLKEVGE